MVQNLTIEEVYARMEDSLHGASDHDVLYAEVTLDSFDVPADVDLDDDDFVDTSTHVWIFAEASLARVERRAPHAGADQNTRDVLEGDRIARVDSHGGSSSHAAQLCSGSDSALVAQLLDCERSPRGDVSVDVDEWRDVPTIALVTRGDHDAWTFESRLLLDPETFLPLAYVIVSDVQEGGDDGRSYRVRGVLKYDIVFVERDSLADDFFERSSIGFVEHAPIPADNLSPDITGMRVYWLGENFDAGLSMPLALKSANTFVGRTEPGALVSLGYGFEAPVDQYRGVGIRLYPRAAEDQIESTVTEAWDGDDVIVTELVVGGIRTKLYRRESQYGDMFLARVYFDATIVVVHDYLGPPPYTDEDAFIRIVEGLRPFER